MQSVWAMLSMDFTHCAQQYPMSSLIIRYLAKVEMPYTVVKVPHHRNVKTVLVKDICRARLAGGLQLSSGIEYYFHL